MGLKTRLYVDKTGSHSTTINDDYTFEEYLFQTERLNRAIIAGNVVSNQVISTVSDVKDPTKKFDTIVGFCN